jgi:pyruvate kinase
MRRKQARSAEEMMSTAEQELLRRGIIKTGDVLGVVAGTQMASGSTNFMRLHMVGEGLDRGGSRAQKSAVVTKARA